MVAYFLAGIGIFLDWDILLVFVLVLRGVSSLAFGVSHDFSSRSHRQCEMMVSKIDNNFELGTLTIELESDNMQTPKNC